MLKLSQAIVEWTPSEKSALRDPLTLLQAGWIDIVGVEVAGNSAPVRVADGTLVVVTRSSAWSHQLSFLAERVLAAVAARLPSCGIERLRFRVGALPKRNPTRSTDSPAKPVRLAGEPSPSGSAQEALAQFARHVEATTRAKRCAGWKACDTCGALIDPSQGARCAACSAARNEGRALAAARLLFEAPWLGFTGTAELVDGLNEKEYERIRSRLLKRWWGMLERARVARRLSRDGRERLVAGSYVLLRSKLPPEEIMPATVRNVLGDELHELLYGDSPLRTASGTS
jgi:Dna[CI] antecedent, DciA